MYEFALEIFLVSKWPKKLPPKNIIIRELFLATFARWQFFPKVPKKKTKKRCFLGFSNGQISIFLKILQNFVRLYINFQKVAKNTECVQI